jgi:hypothetical protein
MIKIKMEKKKSEQMQKEIQDLKKDVEEIKANSSKFRRF